MRPKKDVGMKDVAAAVGVSVVTVSNAFSGKGGVSEEIRREIVEKASELGYVYAPKKPARVRNEPMIAYWFRGGNGKKSALDLPDPFRHHLEEMVSAAGYRLQEISGTFESPDGKADPDGGRRLKETLDGATGLIVAGDWPEEALSRLINAWNGPIVSIENFSAHAAIDFIVSDRYHAAFERAKDLYRVLGNPASPKRSSKESLALILAGPENGEAIHPEDSRDFRPDSRGEHRAMSEDAARMSGFISASFYYHLHESGQSPDSFWRIPDLGNDAVFTDSGKFLERLKGKSPEDYPQAVLCMSEQDAEELKRTCRAGNMKIAEGIWNCGSPDYDAMAKKAAAVLLERIQGKKTGLGVHYVPEVL